MQKFSVFLDFLSETVEIIIAKSSLLSLSLKNLSLSLSKNPQTLSLCPRGSEHKQKKKKMGTLCGLTVTTILLFFLLFVSLSHSFYLPGVAPHDFQSMFPYNPNPLLKICALFHSFTSHCLLSCVVLFLGFPYFPCFCCIVTVV